MDQSCYSAHFRSSPELTRRAPRDTPRDDPARQGSQDMYISLSQSVTVDMKRAHSSDLYS